jgi:RNA polymerase sigma-54 factor
MADNPCLENDGSSSDDSYESDSGDHKEGDWDDTLDAVSDAGADGPIGTGTNQGGFDGEAPAWEATATREKSLQEHLTEQFDQAVTDGKLRLVGRYLIDSLDEAGYLRLDLAEVAERLKVTPDTVDDARAILQGLEPIGVGARDLAECLRLQLHFADNLTPAAEACLAHLDKVAAGEFAWLAKKAGSDEQAVRDALADIRLCNPKPGLGFGSGRIESVVPDVIVEAKEGGGWSVELNGLAFPKVLASAPSRINGGGTQGERARHYLQERYGRAKWLVMALEQRARSIVKVARAIVAAQAGFFEAGAEFMVPLTLRQIAEQVGVHESTVSRVTTGKYMQTPRGVFEFKAFFASGVQSSGGNVQVASSSVQAMIARLVKAENPAKPLSDEAIVKLLKGEGVEVARRTVAKYRGILGIPGTSERRVR